MARCRRPAAWAELTAVSAWATPAWAEATWACWSAAAWCSAFTAEERFPWSTWTWCWSVPQEAGGVADTHWGSSFWYDC